MRSRDKEAERAVLGRLEGAAAIARPRLHQGKELQPRPIVLELSAREFGPLDGVRAFLDPLPRRTAAVVEPNHVLGPLVQVGHDELHARKQVPLMPLHLGHDAA